MTAPAKKTNKIVESIKKGFADIALVGQEGNYQLFLKQVIVLILVFLGFRWCNGKLNEQSRSYLGQISAIQVQKQNESEYLANKKKLLELESLFPDIGDQNNWLLQQVLTVFENAGLKPQLGSQNENSSNSNYVEVSVPVTLQASYSQLGNLVANIESLEEYIRISDFSLAKKPEVLGENTINMNIHTIFPKEKIAPSMFKEARGGN